MATRAIVGSALFHVGVLALVSLLSEDARPGTSTPDPRLPWDVVIPIEVPLTTVTEAEPIPAPNPEPIERSRAPSRSSAEHPRSRPRSKTGKPGPDATLVEPGNAPRLLHSARESARTSTSSRVVIVEPSLLGNLEAFEASEPEAEVGSGAVQGPPPPPELPAEYTFEPENNRLIYHDISGRYIATLGPDGRIDFDNGRGRTRSGIGTPGGLLMAASGVDPHARIKAKMLKATFDMRLEMAVSFHKRQLRRRLIGLEGELETLWADHSRSLGARKESLFQLWDECDEPEDVAATRAELPGIGVVESSEVDDARRDAARSARRMIERFVREHAPRGSAQAYGEAELAGLNRGRASRQSFDPYG